MATVMVIRKISISCGAVVVTILATSWLFVQAAVPSRPNAKELSLARDFVLAACVIGRYPKTALADEAEAWAEGLVERGGLAANAYPALAKLAQTAPEPEMTSRGIALRLRSCVDFVNAPGFGADVRRTLRDAAHAH